MSITDERLAGLRKVAEAVVGRAKPWVGGTGVYENYIATFEPLVVLGMIAEIERLREVVDRDKQMISTLFAALEHGPPVPEPPEGQGATE